MNSNFDSKTPDSIYGKSSESGSEKKTRWKEPLNLTDIKDDRSCKPKLLPISYWAEDESYIPGSMYSRMDKNVLEALKGMTFLKLKLQKYKRRLNNLLSGMKNKDLEIIRLKKKIESLEGHQNPKTTNLILEDMVTLVDTVENLEARLQQVEYILKKKSTLNNGKAVSESEDCFEETFKLDDENFDLIMNQIKEMNQEAGEIQVYHSTQSGATFQRCNSLSLTFFANGFSVEGGIFRLYSERTAQKFIRDIVDGFYPSELQSRFPRGVVLHVSDRRNIQYNDSMDNNNNHVPFRGIGLKLNSDSEDQTDLEDNSPKEGFEVYRENENDENELEKYSANTGQLDKNTGRGLEKNRSHVYRNLPTKTKYGTLQGTSLSDITIRNGEIYKIEKSEGELMKNSEIKYLNKNKKNSNSTVQLKIVSSEDRKCTFLLTMDVSETIVKLRSYLPENLRNCKLIYYLDSCRPVRTILKDSMTLKDCGIDKNSLIMLRKA